MTKTSDCTANSYLHYCLKIVTSHNHCGALNIPAIKFPCINPWHQYVMYPHNDHFLSQFKLYLATKQKGQ